MLAVRSVEPLNQFRARPPRRTENCWIMSSNRAMKHIGESVFFSSTTYCHTGTSAQMIWNDDDYDNVFWRFTQALLVSVMKILRWSLCDKNVLQMITYRVFFSFFFTHSHCATIDAREQNSGISTTCCRRYFRSWRSLNLTDYFINWNRHDDFFLLCYLCLHFSALSLSHIACGLRTWGFWTMTWANAIACFHCRCSRLCCHHNDIFNLILKIPVSDLSRPRIGDNGARTQL